jgi:hypothetical protein
MEVAMVPCAIENITSQSKIGSQPPKEEES